MISERIPNVNEKPYTKSSTEAPPEPMTDAVYRVGTPGGLTRKYVQVTKIYGDKLAKCRVLKSYSESGKSIKSHEGKVINVGFEHLHQPDIFPKFASSSELWLSKANMSGTELKATVANLIDGFMQTEAIAYDLRMDANKTVEGIKTLLAGYIGPFLMTFLISFIKRRIEKVIMEREGKPTQKKTFERKISDMRRLFTKPIPKPEIETKKAK